MRQYDDETPKSRKKMKLGKTQNTDRLKVFKNTEGTYNPCTREAEAGGLRVPWWAEHSLCTREDLSLEPQNGVSCACSPVTPMLGWRWQRLLTSQSSGNDEFQG